MKVYRIDGEILRGQMPDDYQKLRELGVHKIVCLQSGLHDILDGELYTIDVLARKHGIDVVRFPMSGLFMPSWERIMDVVRHLALCESQREAVYVCCKHGKDRTGLVAAAYRVVMEGWKPEAAINEMLKMGFHKRWYFLWLWSFRRMLNKHAAQVAASEGLIGVRH